MEFAPSALLGTWASGIAAVVAVVVWRRIVGPGFTLLGCGVAALFGAPAAIAGAGPAAWMGSGLALSAAALWRRPGPATVTLATAAAAFLVAALADEGPAVAVITGAVFLGGVTVEMLLGHWYLVDPRLPRGTLRCLDGVAAAGAVADLIALSLLGALPWMAGDGPIGIGYLLLGSASIVLIAAVWGALREPGYSGVMAATGLSYLAMLTASGAAVLGRLLLDPPVL